MDDRLSYNLKLWYIEARGLIENWDQNLRNVKNPGILIYRDCKKKICTEYYFRQNYRGPEIPNCNCFGLTLWKKCTEADLAISLTSFFSLPYENFRTLLLTLNKLRNNGILNF